MFDYPLTVSILTCLATLEITVYMLFHFKRAYDVICVYLHFGMSCFPAD